MIYWDASPEIFSLGPISLRWYGLLFAAGFVVAFQILKRIFQKKKIPIWVLDRLLIYTIVGTVVGARLGHCLFYEPAYYLQNPLEILKIWKGGLASHGGAIGIIVAAWIFSRRQKYLGFLSTLDHIALPVPLVGCFIRLGNLMNSEILGKPTDASWGVIFERVDPIARHPVQAYESLAYLIVFAALYQFYRWKKFITNPGMILGLSLAGIFGARFFLEFFKTEQASYQTALPLSVGQLLSIPFVAVGIFLAWRARGSNKVNAN